MLAVRTDPPPAAGLAKVLPFLFEGYRGTSLIRNCLLLGPYNKPVPRVIWWSLGVGGGLMSEIPL